MEWIKALEVNVIGIVQFSTRKVGQNNLHYYESDTESRVSLIFTPGGLNPELWNQQLRYFSRNFHTISFRPTVSSRGFEGEKSALKSILNQKHVDKAVLVSNTLGNSIAQEFSQKDNVISTVLTNPRRKFRKLPQRRLLKTLYKMGRIKPKIASKLFFSKQTSYKTVKQFMETLELPDYMDLKTFIHNHEPSKPSEDTLVIASGDDRISDLSFAKSMRPKVSLSIVKSAGTFSYFEKPQEFNKALLDFVKILERKKANKTTKINTSLDRFQSQEIKSERPQKPKKKVRV